MTGPGRHGRQDPATPPDWFVQARQASERTAVLPVPGRAAAGPTPPGPPLPGNAASTVAPEADLDDAGTTAGVGARMKTATTAGVVRAGAQMAVATVVSRVTGLLSKMAILAILGVNFTSTAYTVANTLPNIVFELLIGGVLTSVAIPLLTRAQRSDPDGGLEYTQRLLTIALVGLAVATVIAVACAPLLAHLYLSAGSSRDGRTTELTTQFGRLLLPQMFFYGVAALFGAILNTKERFAANAWAPVVNNILVIGVAVVLVASHHQRGQMSRQDLLILGVGTTLGIVMQALVMIPSLLRSGFRFRWRWGWDPRLTEAGGLAGWAIVYVLVSQVGVVVTTNVANKHDAGGPVTFSYASLLFQMPYGILGVAVLTAIMPRLSRHAADGRMAQVKDDVSLANRLSAVALLPVSAALVVLGTSVSIALFRYRNVTLEAAQQIGLTISALAVGLLPLAMTLVQMRVFYATKDGRTPTLINAIMVAVRVPLLLAAMQLSGNWVIPGLAAATAVSYVVGAVVGEIWLRARFGPMGTSRTLRTIAKMTVASAAGGIAAYAVVQATVGRHIGDGRQALLALMVGGTVGLIVIAAAAALLRVSELLPLQRRLLRMAGRRPAAVADGTVLVPADGMAGSAGPLAANPAQPRSAQQRAADSPTIRKQVFQRVTHPDSAGAPGAPGAAGAPGAPGAAVPPPAADPRAADLLADDTTARPEGGAGADETLHIGPFAELAPGATVGGRYRLVSLVAGDDAGNRFWRAKDTVLPRDMAVTLLPGGSATAATVARTLRVGRLHHIGLPQTLDVGTEQGQSYVVGQWVDGATLTDLLAGGPLEPDVATSITAKVSEAVAEAHRNGIALGAINPSLVRVNFDGQVRLSHVIANGSATPDQDIRAVGGLLYLMLTGLWPLPGASNTVDAAGPGGFASSQSAGIGQLTAAPTRLGRAVPAAEVRPAVPTPLSALAERALHPDDPAGIRAVGAIAALLRQPETPAAGAAPEEEPARPVLNPGERRLVRERRVKLGVASVMIAAFSALIIIVVASLSKQVMDSVAGPTVTSVQKLTDVPTTQATTPAKTLAKPPPPATPTTASATTTAASTATPPAATVQQITDATVYDPNGDGVKDNTDQVPQAFDGNPQTSWATFVYKLQFPSSLKPGVGLTLTFANPITPTTVTVTSDTPPTTIEVRAAAGPDLPYDQTTPLARGVISNGTPGLPGSTTITLAGAPKSKYLVVFVVGMAPHGQRFESHLNEITVNGY